MRLVIEVILLLSQNLQSSQPTHCLYELRIWVASLGWKLIYYNTFSIWYIVSVTCLTLYYLVNIVLKTILMCTKHLVCVTEQHYLSIFCTRVWSVGKAMLFRYIGRLVTSQQKCHFYSLFASFLLVIWFCIYTHAQLKSWNFKILCIKNQRFAYRPCLLMYKLK